MSTLRQRLNYIKSQYGNINILSIGQMHQVFKAFKDDNPDFLAEIVSCYDDVNSIVFPYNKLNIPANLAGQFLLYIAVFFGAQQCVDYLISMGAVNPNFTLAHESQDIFLYAAMSGNIQIFKMLMQNTSISDHRKPDIIDVALQFGRLDLVKYLWSIGFKTQHLMSNAVFSGNIDLMEFVKSISTQGFGHENEKNNSILMKSLNCLTSAPFLWLLDNGYKMNQDIIIRAIKRGSLKAVKMFHKKYNLDKMLTAAIEADRLAIVRYLITIGASPNPSKNVGIAIENNSMHTLIFYLDHYKIAYAKPLRKIIKSKNLSFLQIFASKGYVPKSIDQNLLHQFEINEFTEGLAYLFNEYHATSSYTYKDMDCSKPFAKLYFLLFQYNPDFAKEHIYLLSYSENLIFPEEGFQIDKNTNMKRFMLFYLYNYGGLNHPYPFGYFAEHILNSNALITAVENGYSLKQPELSLPKILKHCSVEFFKTYIDSADPAYYSIIENYLSTAPATEKNMEIYEIQQSRRSFKPLLHLIHINKFKEITTVENVYEIISGLYKAIESSKSLKHPLEDSIFEKISFLVQYSNTHHLNSNIFLLEIMVFGDLTELIKKYRGRIKAAIYVPQSLEMLTILFDKRGNPKYIKINEKLDIYEQTKIFTTRNIPVSIPDKYTYGASSCESLRAGKIIPPRKYNDLYIRFVSRVNADEFK